MNEIKESPAKRFRRLLASSLLYLKLPRKFAFSEAEQNDEKESKSDLEQGDSADLSDDSSAPSSGSESDPGHEAEPKGIRRIFGPTLWNIASVLSLSVNVILFVMIFFLAVALNSYGMRMSSMVNLGASLLGGLYGNFEKMERAHIVYNLPVNASVPVQFDLQINQQTSVVLSQDVTVNNARVTVNTGGLNITQANTTIVLPQGTTLPVNLNLTVPVITSLPIVLNVPVDIPLQNTQLQEPFAGLQNVIKPLYCLLDNGAVNLDQIPICQ